MENVNPVWTVAAGVLLVNLPFGFWRAGVRKFSLPWILAVHVPVPLVITLRILSGLGWQLATFPVMVGAFFTGQFLGGKLRGWWVTRKSDRRPLRGGSPPSVHGKFAAGPRDGERHGTGEGI